MRKLLWKLFPKFMLKHELMLVRKMMGQLGMSEGDFQYVASLLCEKKMDAAKNYVTERMRVLESHKQFRDSQKAACKPTVGRLP